MQPASAASRPQPQARIGDPSSPWGGGVQPWGVTLGLFPGDLMPRAGAGALVVGSGEAGLGEDAGA